MLREVELAELTRLASEEAEYDYWSFEDGNELNAYECPCGRCVN